MEYLYQKLRTRGLGADRKEPASCELFICPSHPPKRALGLPYPLIGAGFQGQSGPCTAAALSHLVGSLYLAVLHIKVQLLNLISALPSDQILVDGANR